MDLRYNDHKTRPSRICFRVRKATAWNAATGEYEGAPARSADLYVFCDYPEREKERVKVLDVPAGTSMWCRCRCSVAI